MSTLYLDHAAATPLDDDVAAAMQPYLSTSFHNPSALYQAARDVRRDLERARAAIAGRLGARPSEIIFTAGGTESDNLAIHGVMRNYSDANLVVSAVEHDAVLRPAERYDRRIVPVNPDGLVTLEAVEATIDDNTVLVSIMYANNEIGTIQPLAKIGQLITRIRDERRKAGNRLPLLLHSDACQATNYLDLHVARLGVDLLTINGGKLYGPKQSGALYVKGGLELVSLIDGGGQERGLRSGTENVAAYIGLAAALDTAQAMRTDETKRLQTIQKHAFEQMGTRLPQAIIRGSLKHRLPNNLHLTLPGKDNERLLIELDQAGIQAAAGSACSASSDTPSHVLRAIGLSDQEARSSLRFSFGRSTTQANIDRLVDELCRLST